MQIESDKELKWNILKRLQRLPYDQIGLIRRSVMQKTSCTQSKYYRVIQEKDNDVHVLIALSEVLNCKVDDIINPGYEFKDPQLTKSVLEKVG
ncbi:hypothetical protein [Xanthocytophaga agilis]|uniref:Uncharacterized protein n=1 Tax=Xanthocytophaga agilis TaxID=3048010 RepID=A0AAE3RE40_9BACT|nr:hypothetical protein [Xanthocytophaga agilis]MDJ1506482.1 hypothetical protein [Xanthocytophaga agilis]